MAVLGGDGAASQNFDAVLLAAQHGAAWASRSVWNDYSPAVASFLRARGSREADDLTSEVFLAVFDGLHDFTGGESEFRSFVFSIAYRRLVDELRKRTRRGDHVAWDDAHDPRHSASAETMALDRLGESSARTILDRLPADQRDVMVLRIIADLTVEQVASVTGRSQGAVKALQRRALESLRKKFS